MSDPCEAAAASRAKDEFLKRLGHELRNRLGAVSAAVEVLNIARPDGETAAEARGIIARQTRILVHMMNDLLDADRLVAGKVPPAAEAPARADADTVPPSRRRKVLVIDDNADVLAALRSKLELDGHMVNTAVDGFDGLSSLLRLQPEVSIVDIGLPGLTGYELARHARAAGYAGRMIALSRYGAERDVNNALVAGFDAYLVKPVDRKQLRASLSAD